MTAAVGFCLKCLKLVEADRRENAMYRSEQSLGEWAKSRASTIEAGTNSWAVRGLKA